MRIVKQPISLAILFLWLGFIGGISFLEAWLKFQAPGITLPLGLGIGKLVFTALNKIEWLFAAVIVIDLLLKKTNLLKGKDVLLIISIVLLMIQTVWLLPELNNRADLYIAGVNVPKSLIHFYYVGAEIVKVILLVVFGLSLFGKSAK